MSNAYGFDFLRTEHLDESAQQDVAPARGAASTEDEPGAPTTALSEERLIQVQNMSQLEKQFIIISFLQAHRGSGCLSPAVLYKSTGVDLNDPANTDLAEMIQKNPKVKVEMLPDPENPALLVATYAYQAKYSSVRDRTTLLAQINRKVSGVPCKDLMDSYPNAEADILALIAAGDVVAVNNTEDKDKILFPRGEAFLVELDGIVSLKQPPQGHHQQYHSGQESLCTVEIDVDPTSQVRRGEAIQVGGEWFRVSSAVKAGVPLSEQPARAQAPLSVVSLQDLPKRNEVDGYIRPLNSRNLPLDNALSSEGAKNLQQARVAREKLAKLAHGARISSSAGGGGSLGHLVSQALGSLAHSGNPTALAGAAASSSSGPSAMGSSSSSIRRRQNRSAAGGGGAHPHGAAGRDGGGITKEELIQAASDLTLATCKFARRHGCTKDLREMYLATRSLVPESDEDLKAKLVEHKLLEPNEEMRRPRLNKRGTGNNLDNDGKPKKRRYYERKNQRMTNTHLDNTPEGAVLALALEAQKQGKSVGDGGM